MSLVVRANFWIKELFNNMVLSQFIFYLLVAFSNIIMIMSSSTAMQSKINNSSILELWHWRREDTCTLVFPPLRGNGTTLLVLFPLNYWMWPQRLPGNMMLLAWYFWCQAYWRCQLCYLRHHARAQTQVQTLPLANTNKLGVWVHVLSLDLHYSCDPRR